MATQWPGELVEKPNHPINNFFEEADDRRLIAGACGFCADSFHATEGCEKAGVETLGGPGEHAPKPSELVDEGYEHGRNFIARSAGGNPAQYEKPGMLLHLLYGTVAGGVLVALAVAALDVSLVGDLGGALLWGVVLGTWLGLGILA